MGTSSAFGGQGGGTPLVPSWLGDGGVPAAPPPVGPAPTGVPPAAAATPAALPQDPIPAPAAPGRFSAARTNFSRFASSGGDRRSLGRAISHYVRSAAGGAKTAASRMGASRGAGSRLIGFLTDAASRGVTEALKALNLGALAGRPIDEIFVGLVDYVCPDGGSIDEGISRQAFIETITQLAEAGVTDFNGLTAEQMQMVFELFATNAIEARICNDIGTKVIVLPTDPETAASVQHQLHDFIQRAVSDALTSASTAMTALTPDRVLEFVDGVYEQAYSILLSMGEAAAEAA